MPRRFRHHDFERRPDGGLDEMAAMRRRVRLAEDDVRVHVRVVALDRDVAYHRQDFNLFFNWDVLVPLR